MSHSEYFSAQDERQLNEAYRQHCILMRMQEESQELEPEPQLADAPTVSKELQNFVAGSLILAAVFLVGWMYWSEYLK